jgi:ABC-2 type transport system permease protein
MFADAFSSETYKLWRNRTVWFWGFLFAPLVALAIGVVGVVYLHAKAPPEIARAMPADIAHQTLNALAQASQPLTVLFALIAAAVLFGGEYRWETWRLRPRPSRREPPSPSWPSA